MLKIKKVMRQFINEHKYYFLFIVISSILSIIASFYDSQIVIFVNSNRPRVLDSFFGPFTDYGNYVAGVIYIATGIFGMIKKEYKKYAILGLTAMLSFILSDLVITNSLKVIIN